MSSSEDRKTTIGDSSGSSRRETRVAIEKDDSVGSNYGDSLPSLVATFKNDDRKIVGFVISYTWRQAGQYSPITLGKNFIGSRQVEQLPGDPYSHIKIEKDQKMSASHALILCRELRKGGEVQFDLIDQESSNGTYLNDRLIALSGETIVDNYVKITTGSTVWTLIKIDPDQKKSSQSDNT